ncbi:TetR/AcrR family transcriptional regulator [Paraburkholderia sp. D1E]|uniref:TetR/AcrR family transcriptional regulator n=1 Tax=Paraburkholderia sp. D1E TaxID=3461398 RepID=UPI004045944B
MTQRTKEKPPQTSKHDAASTPAAPPGRRPQAQRSAETQAKLIAAAISCLHRFGYSATSVTMVAEEAQVSRGAMTHQYPTRTDLMLAVVEAVYQQDVAHYERTVKEMPPLQWMRELPSTMWDVMSQPSGTAVMEIMLASRSDPELADKLREIQTGIDRMSHPWIVERLEAAGLRDHPNGEAIHRVFVAAIRGLSLEALFRRDRAEDENAVAVLSEMLRLLYPEIEAAPKKKRK